MGFLIQGIVDGLFGLVSPLGTARSLVGHVLRGLRGAQPHRHRDDDAVHRGDLRAGAGDPGLLLSVLASGKLDSGLWTNIPPEEGGSSFLPKGIGGIFLALPFAIWFYLAIEELPLAAEESHDPKRDIPRATIWGLLTLIVTGIGVLFLNTGVARGADELGTSAAPLFDGVQAVFGDGTSAELLALIAVDGPDRQLLHHHLRLRPQHLLAVAGRLLPQWLSVTHGSRKTPHRALIAGAVVGYALAVPHLPARQQGPGREDRRRAALHGRVRGRHLLLHAVPGVHHAAPQVLPTSSGPTAARSASGAPASPG